MIYLNYLEQLYSNYLKKCRANYVSFCKWNNDRMLIYLVSQNVGFRLCNIQSSPINYHRSSFWNSFQLEFVTCNVTMDPLSSMAFIMSHFLYISSYTTSGDGSGGKTNQFESTSFNIPQTCVDDRKTQNRVEI